VRAGGPSAIGYIPIVTTVVALAFTVVLWRRYRRRGGMHLFWWGIGTLTYALGTITESLTTLFGWHEPVFRAWYITGALLGGAPLAQGTVYLLLSRRTANRMTLLAGAFIAVAAGCTLLSPINYALVEPYHLTGKVLAWQWVRRFSPFINLYAVSFLIGGAILSAVRYRRRRETRHRYLGNVCIAVGALLPGIGGAFTRFGHTEVLYVTELLGLLTIYAGYRLNTAVTAETGPAGTGRDRSGEPAPPPDRPALPRSPART
jgi:hypothetical protein